MMKKITVPSLIFFVVSLLFFQPRVLDAQEKDTVRYDVLSIETGYAAFVLPHHKEFLDQSISGMAAQYNIRMQKLNEFPNNWIVGGAYSYRATETVRIDVGGWYTQTKGAMGHRDLNGRIREDLRLHIFYARAGAQIDVLKSGPVDVYSAVHAGLTTTRLEIDDTIEFSGLSDYNVTSGSMIRSYYLTADLAVGARTQMLGVVVSVECGYRLNNEDHSSDLSDNLGGWTLSSRLGLPLWW